MAMLSLVDQHLLNDSPAFTVLFRQSFQMTLQMFTHLLFGRGDIFLNNIAWALRRLPLFGVFGDGMYRLQPMHVDDFAEVAAREALGRDSAVRDCVGPETFTYRELVGEVARAIGVRRPIVSVPSTLGHAFVRAVGPFVGDVILTREEVEGLMRGLLWSDQPSPGCIRLTEWAREHRETLGRRYASEIGRRRKRDVAYESI